MMNEWQRQSYLSAMGLTPWVARAPLPGAAEPVWLDVPAPAADAAPVAEAAPASAPASEPAAPVAAQPADGAPPAGADGVPDLSALLQHGGVTDAPPAGEAETATAVTPAGDVTPITVLCFRVGELTVAVAQADPQAPGLGRDAQQLLNNLLAVFPGKPAKQATFAWPMLDAVDAGETFKHFLLHGGVPRVLLCADETTCQALGLPARYAPTALDDITVMAVSALDEMLAAPATHKRQSWQAMLEHGFAPRRA